jgi:hypothetical protein
MGKKNSKKNNIIKAKTYSSEKIHLNIRDLESDFYRADVVLEGLNVAVPSYEGRIFINNPKANYDTPTDLDHGYVGSYFVFGHGSCLGDAGHCDVHGGRLKYDVIPRPLTKYDQSVIITDKLKELGKTAEDFTVTVVPYVCQPPKVALEEVDLENIVKVDKISIVAYDKEQD